MGGIFSGKKFKCPIAGKLALVKFLHDWNIAVKLWQYNVSFTRSTYISYLWTYDTAPYVMLLMWANPLRGQMGGGWALEIETFLGPVKMASSR
jgi:hypothetical protein